MRLLDAWGGATETAGVTEPTGSATRDSAALSAARPWPILLSRLQHALGAPLENGPRVEQTDEGGLRGRLGRGQRGAALVQRARRVCVARAGLESQ